MKKRVLAAMALMLVGLVASSLALGAGPRHKPRMIYPTTAVPATPACPTPGAADEPSPRPQPSKALLAAFGVLRRDHADDDTPPAGVIAELRARGASFDPGAARLLRTGPHGGKAWIVPVLDVNALTPIVMCGRFLDRPARARPVPRKFALPVPVPARPSAKRSRRRVLTPRLRLVMPAYALRPARPRPPEEGVVVASVNGAPSGGGGALDDLVRGREAPDVRPCGGVSGHLTSISGVVPDGVPAAFLTSPDGTAVKADVHDNAYTFLVAPLTRPEPRYVVWLRDGFPHVQALPRIVTSSFCPPGLDHGVEVTPGSAFGRFGPFALDAPPLPALPPVVAARPYRVRPAPAPRPVTPRG